MNKFKQIFIFSFVAFLLVSCASYKKIVYFQDEQIGKQQVLNQGKPITVKPEDMISIVVTCREPQLTAMFNLAYVSQGIGGNASSIDQNRISGYTVDSEGNIDFPVIGKISVEGLNREEIKNKVKDELVKRELVKDPVVTVSFLNLQFSVLGEVLHPGQFSISKDRVSILDALSMAGDLTVYGMRDKVNVTRFCGGGRVTYQLNIRSTDIYKSPAFYIKQNDIIYVEPNKVKANESTVNGNKGQDVSVWISIASVLTTLGVIIFR